MDGSGQNQGSRGRPILGGDSKPSRLSADAAVFVPRGFATQPPQLAPHPMSMGMPAGLIQQQQHHQQVQNGFAGYRSEAPQPWAQPQYAGHPNQGGGHQPGGGFHRGQGHRSGGHHGGRGRGGGAGGGPGSQHGHYRQPAAPVAQPRQPAAPADPVTHLKKSVCDLTNNPGDFDAAMPDLANELSASIHSEEVLVKAVEEIFLKSVMEANFRYTGARVCNYLSHHLTTSVPSGNFRHFLLKRCQQEHLKREDLIDSDETRHHVLGFTLFLAELLSNMTLAGGQGRMDVVATAIQELLLTMMSRPADTTLRCTVQVLKLTGAHLEDAEKRANPETPNMNAIFAKIKENTLDEQLHRSVRAQLLSVIELRATDWEGCREEVPQPQPPPSQPPPAPNNFPNVPVQPPWVPNPAPPSPQSPELQQQQGIPVFYDEQGQVIGMDENMFVPDEAFYPEFGSGEGAWSTGDDLNFYDNVYSTPGVECIGEEEMDPEIAAAFREFLGATQPAE